VEKCTVPPAAGLCGARSVPKPSTMEPPVFTHERVRALLSEHPTAKPMLWGTLPETPAPELLSFIALSRRSGLLLWRTGRVEGGLAFADGQVLLVRSGVQDEDARAMVVSLLRSEGGLFAFLGDASLRGHDPGGRLDTRELLLDCLRLLDEESRATG